MGRPTIAQLQEHIRRQEAVFVEKIAELELDLEDRAWQRLRSAGETDFEFSREALREIARQSRLMFLKNPLVRRAVLLRTDYTFGQGVSFRARNDKVQAIVETFLADGKNQEELTAPFAQQERDHELQRDGNLFFVFFESSAGDTRVRTIPFDEIEDVLTNPEDRREPRYYLRRIDGVTSEWKLYPDFQYKPETREPSVYVADLQKDVAVKWATPVYHVRVNAATSGIFGVSELYAIQDWAASYNEFLSNWATIVRSYARWAWKLTAKASKIPAIKAQLESRIGADTPQPAPATGSIFASETTDMQPLRTSGATTAAEDGRRLLLMVCAGTGFPESFFGDVSVGSLATAKSLDRPTELQIMGRQRLWQGVWENLFGYVIERKIASGTAGLVGYYGAAADDPWGEVRFIVEPDQDADQEDPNAPADIHVDVAFPAIIERDVPAEVTALVSAATLNGLPMAGTLSPEYVTRRLLVALGETSIEETMAELFPEESEEETATEAALAVAIGRLNTFLEANRAGR